MNHSKVDEDGIKQELVRMVGIAKFFRDRVKVAHNDWCQQDTPECWKEIEGELEEFKKQYPKVPTNKIDRAVYLVLGKLILQTRMPGPTHKGAILERMGTPHCKLQMNRQPQAQDYYFPLDLGELTQELANPSGSATFDWGVLDSIAKDLEGRVLRDLRMYISPIAH